MAIHSHRLTFVSVLVFTNLTIAGLMLGTLYSDSFAYAVRANVTASNPIVVDPELEVELYFKGLKAPTSMIFLGPDDILVTQKNEGTVERIVNATQSPQPLITVPAASKDERGLLGMAISTDPSNKTFVFLYYTEKGAKKGEAMNRDRKSVV